MNRRTIRTLDIVALTLATIGALNWGLSGAANFNLVRRIFGRGSLLERAIYVVVGLAGLDLAWLTARFLGAGRPSQMTGPVTGTVSGMMEEAGRTMQQVGSGVQQAGSNIGQPSGMYQPGTGIRP
jgi:uncharacterized protein